MEFQIKITFSIMNILVYDSFDCLRQINYTYQKIIILSYLILFQYLTIKFFFSKLRMCDDQICSENSWSFQYSKFVIQQRLYKQIQRLVLIIFIFFCLQQIPGLIQISMASFFNIGHLEDLDSFGDHLFDLGHRLLRFSGEDPSDETENKLETRISSEEKAEKEGKEQKHLSSRVWEDGQFQMGFMTEHRFVLQRYINKFITLFLKEGEAAIISPNEHKEEPCLLDLLSLLQQQIQSITGTKVESTTVEFFQNSKMVNLFTYILQTYKKKVSLSLLRMGLLIWIEHSALDDKNLRERELIEFACKLLSLNTLKNFRKMLPVDCQQVNLRRIKSFANAFVNTLLFVAAGYFVNPYYQLEKELVMKEFQQYELLLYDDMLNDLQDDEEECEQIRGRKMVKTDLPDEFQ